jgi:hypothetical protein
VKNLSVRKTRYSLRAVGFVSLLIAIGVGLGPGTVGARADAVATAPPDVTHAVSLCVGTKTSTAPCTYVPISIPAPYSASCGLDGVQIFQNGRAWATITTKGGTLVIGGYAPFHPSPQPTSIQVEAHCFPRKL